jgi:hypothetical protein
LYLTERHDKQSGPDAQFARLKFGAPGKPGSVILPAKLLGAIYVAIGIFLAANKDYFQNLDTVKRVLSALLGILLWPLLLLDVNLHIK